MLVLVTPVVGDDESSIDEVTVTSQRRDQPVLRHSGNIDRVQTATIDAVGHQHVSELLTRIPGTWISRGSGQESLPSIRSPVLTGAGSCGAFLTLEDGIPTRPAGFCNVNQLFELGTELADRLEIIRGPGTALYGSNALHGIVNVISRSPDSTGATVEVGSNRFLRARATLSGERSTASLLYANDGGFRDASGYRQGKLHTSTDVDVAGGGLRLALSASHLDQDTAGFITGEDAFRDPSVNRSNPNPEAFREADSQRLYGLWRNEDGVEIRPFLRRSRMHFLQHFLPGQPLEQNGHVSAGLIASTPLAFYGAEAIAGIDIEWADVELRQTQSGPAEGSDFLRETRPVGKHYDYDVRSSAIAPWLHTEFAVSQRLVIDAGMRAEYVRYDYANNMLVGNTRDDGTVCGFGGCLYSRPADRNDSFSNLAPKVGVRFDILPGNVVFARLARGFRAPQMTELYRLQSGQTTADLDSERVDSFELGWRRQSEVSSLEIVAYAMQKRGSVLRDAEGFNVSNGRSRHVGIETGVKWRLSDNLAARFNASIARHTYDFDAVAARGETFRSGNDVDTAPRHLGSLEILWAPAEPVNVALQWTLVGRYYLDAENRFTYGGHDLVNARGSIDFGRFALTARLNNLADTAYADRADYAFGNYRYFPGRGREVFLELRYEQ